MFAICCAMPLAPRRGNGVARQEPRFSEGRGRAGSVGAWSLQAAKTSVPQTTAAKVSGRIGVVRVSQRPNGHGADRTGGGYESVIVGDRIPICNKCQSCPDQAYLLKTSALYRGSSSRPRNHQLDVVWVVSASEILRSGFAAR